MQVFTELILLSEYMAKAAGNQKPKQQQTCQNTGINHKRQDVIKGKGPYVEINKDQVEIGCTHHYEIDVKGEGHSPGKNILIPQEFGGELEVRNRLHGLIKEFIIEKLKPGQQNKAPDDDYQEPVGAQILGLGKGA